MNLSGNSCRAAQLVAQRAAKPDHDDKDLLRPYRASVHQPNLGWRARSFLFWLFFFARRFRNLATKKEL